MSISGKFLILWWVSWVVSAVVFGGFASSPAFGQNAVLSPDRSKSAFVADGRLLVDDVLKTATDSLDSKDSVRPVAEHKGFQISDISWSPNGEAIAYTTDHSSVWIVGIAENSRWKTNYKLGSGLKDVTDLVWSPDGTRMAYTSKSVESMYTVDYDLWVVDFTHSNPDQRRITDKNTCSDGNRVVWSADGTEIAYTRYLPAPTIVCGVFVVNATYEGAEPKELDSLGFHLRVHSWSPDRGKVFYYRPDSRGAGGYRPDNLMYVARYDGNKYLFQDDIEVKAFENDLISRGLELVKAMPPREAEALKDEKFGGGSTNQRQLQEILRKLKGQSVPIVNTLRCLNLGYSRLPRDICNVIAEHETGSEYSRFFASIVHFALRNAIVVRATQWW